LLATQDECRYLSRLIGIDSDKQVVFNILSGARFQPPERKVVSLDRKCVGASSRIRARSRRCCPEAFSIRRLEGRRWQWRALLWS